MLDLSQFASYRIYISSLDSKSSPLLMFSYIPSPTFQTNFLKLFLGLDSIVVVLSN